MLTPFTFHSIFSFVKIHAVWAMTQNLGCLCQKQTSYPITPRLAPVILYNFIIFCCHDNQLYFWDKYECKIWQHKHKMTDVATHCSNCGARQLTAFCRSVSGGITATTLPRSTPQWKGERVCFLCTVTMTLRAAREGILVTVSENKSGMLSHGSLISFWK